MTTLLHRFHNFDDDHMITRAEAARIAGVSSSTLCNHSYAGLLPFIPGRPVHVRLGDLRVYLKMMANGVRGKLHPSMRVEHNDRQSYSPLHGVSDFYHKEPDAIINTVVRETGFLWKKYKDASKAKAKKAKRKDRKAATLDRSKAA